MTRGTPSPAPSAEAILKEANDLKQIMDAGSLPATLQPEPISVESISPDMGADNIASGVRSAYIAVLAVVLFMLAYYTITGLFADLALMLNLSLVLATMALIRGTFTLPGIAGLVLTLGMAVDANVLINERIREEIHRGASLWMAIKQGYDKVFWTIFDANLTTSLTSIVLILVGSEEVKGFGVTLLIGLIIHMFTALFVTRTFMMAAVKWGVLKAVDDHSLTEYVREIFTLTWLRNGHWPFMKVITVSKIDWIGKRHFFWGVSAVITVAGLIAFFARGDAKYDIEFRGGTQVTFQLKDPYADLVQNLVSLSAERDVYGAHPEMKDLEDRLKEARTLEARTDMVRKLAGVLEADKALAEKHPVIGEFSGMMQKAETQKSLTIDEVRSRVEGLKSLPGLDELKNARVYSVGSAADRRFQMQTTIANAPQNLEETLPEPLKAELGAKVANPRISHDNTATQLHRAGGPAGEAGGDGVKAGPQGPGERAGDAGRQAGGSRGHCVDSQSERAQDPAGAAGPGLQGRAGDQAASDDQGRQCGGPADPAGQGCDRADPRRAGAPGPGI
jgi:protein-export SecD/SecF family membrane protein